MGFPDQTISHFLNLIPVENFKSDISPTEISHFATSHLVL